MSVPATPRLIIVTGVSGSGRASAMRVLEDLGFYCVDNSKKELILLYQDIRDLIPQGFVVNDHEALVDPNDLVRLKDVLKLRFDLMNKPVVNIGSENV